MRKPVVVEYRSRVEPDEPLDAMAKVGRQQSMQAVLDEHELRELKKSLADIELIRRTAKRHRRRGRLISSYSRNASNQSRKW
jgi:hypothetical protein